MLLVLLVGVLPFAVVTASLGREASGVYRRIDSGEWKPALYLRSLFDALPVWVTALLERAGVADFDNLQRQHDGQPVAQGTPVHCHPCGPESGSTRSALSPALG